MQRLVVALRLLGKIEPSVRACGLTGVPNGHGGPKRGLSVT